jgi:hypothetical protein
MASAPYLLLLISVLCPELYTILKIVAKKIFETLITARLHGVKSQTI